MRISAKVDYAVRALCELAAHQGDAPLKAEEISRAQEIPLSFLENILVDLRRAGFVRWCCWVRSRRICSTRRRRCAR